MNELETKVLEIIGESTSSPDVFADTDDGLEPIRDSINDAIQEIVSITGSKREDYYLPLRQEQMFYRLQPNTGFFGWVVDAWNINVRRRLRQTDLIALAKRDPRWMVPTGEPREYIQLGTNIVGLYPKPSGDSNTLKLTIVQIPAPYKTSADRLHVRDEFRDAVVNYAVAEYWASRGDVRSADTHFGYYLKTVGIRDTLSEHRDWSPRMQTEKSA